MSLGRQGRGALDDVVLLTLRMCFPGLHFPSLAPLQVVLVTAGLLDMFGSDVKTLHHDAVANCLRHLDADGCAGNIEHAARTPLVELVWHALHDGRVDMNVDEIANLEDLKIGREMLISLLAERLSEEIARVRALSVRANHCDCRIPEGELVRPTQIPGGVATEVNGDYKDGGREWSRLIRAAASPTTQSF